MKTFLISVVALGAFAGAALAASSFDGNDQAPYRAGIPDVTSTPDSTIYVTRTPLSVVEQPSLLPSTNGWFMGKYGLTKDPDDIRRWDEKNN